MRKNFLFWLAPWLAIGMSACATFRTPEQPPSLDVAKACAQWRWIGVSRSGSQCPEVPGWAVKPLFPQLVPPEESEARRCSEEAEPGDVHVPDLKLIRELNRFCVYETVPAAGDPPRPPVSAGLVRVDQDCAALSLAGETVPAALKQESLLSVFSQQAGTQPFPIQNPEGVRLAFLDTEPTREEIADRRGRSPHGYTLIHLGQGLVCNQGRCAARVTSRLALPVRSFNPEHPAACQIDTVQGGYMGLQSHVAQAIRDEVDDWRQTRSPDRERHLVLNLSLAWDGRLFGGLDEESISEMRAGTQAVYRALQYAASYDVLVLAAAGNSKGSPCESSGPLLPAAWERVEPREGSCGDRRRDAPLVYAVGGVRSDGSPLINARRRGMPLRVAYGENAPVPAADPPAFLTGSSVSTAVVSSIAAAVWSSFPDRSSREIMDLLDASGDPLSFDADFWFEVNTAAKGVLPGSPRVRRLSLCKALQTAWNEWHPKGEPVVNLGCSRWVISQSLPRTPDWIPDSCQPWSRPQPETPPCLSCGPPDITNP